MLHPYKKLERVRIAHRAIWRIKTYHTAHDRDPKLGEKIEVSYLLPEEAYDLDLDKLVAAYHDAKEK